MNPIELFHRDGKSTGIFYCEKCRIVHREKARAEACCQPVKCSVCGAANVRQYHTKCDACTEADRSNRELERFEKAEKLTTWDGPVYSDGHGSNDGYFSDLAEFEDWIADGTDAYDEPVIRPAYVWACTSIPFCVLDIDHIIENACQEAFEDWSGHTDGYDELEAAIKIFNEANKGLISWQVDYKRAVIIPRIAEHQVTTNAPE